MITHHLFSELCCADGKAWGEDSSARFSCAANPDTAIVFLHGFNGGAVTTWLDFPELLARNVNARGSDLFFIGYQSTREQIPASATRFRGLLKALGTSPATDVVNPSIPPGATYRDRTFAYARIIVCAHSQGAVVARRALLDARRLPKGAPWLERVRLVLFAPAHKGARILALLSATIGVIGSKFAALSESALQFRYPPLQDLDQQSATLKALEQETIAALSGAPTALDCLRAYVLHGSGDNVVHMDGFADDYPMALYDGATHISVCKPRGDLTMPLDFLVEAMK